MKEKDEEKGLKSLRDIYEKPWLRVQYYILCQIIMDQGRKGSNLSKDEII